MTSYATDVRSSTRVALMNLFNLPELYSRTGLEWPISADELARWKNEQ